MPYYSKRIHYKLFTLLYNVCTLLYKVYTLLYIMCSLLYKGFSLLYNSCTLLYKLYNSLDDVQCVYLSKQFICLTIKFVNHTLLFVFITLHSLTVLFNVCTHKYTICNLTIHSVYLNITICVTCYTLYIPTFLLDQTVRVKLYFIKDFVRLLRFKRFWPHLRQYLPQLRLQSKETLSLYNFKDITTIWREYIWSFKKKIVDIAI